MKRTFICIAAVAALALASPAIAGGKGGHQGGKQYSGNIGGGKHGDQQGGGQHGGTPHFSGGQLTSNPTATGTGIGTGTATSYGSTSTNNNTANGGNATGGNATSKQNQTQQAYGGNVSDSGNSSSTSSAYGGNATGGYSNATVGNVTGFSGNIYNSVDVKSGGSDSMVYGLIGMSLLNNSGGLFGWLAPAPVVHEPAWCPEGMRGTPPDCYWPKRHVKHRAPKRPCATVTEHDNGDGTKTFCEAASRRLP